MVLRVNLIHLPGKFNLILNTRLTTNFDMFYKENKFIRTGKSGTNTVYKERYRQSMCKYMSSESRRILFVNEG
jgi:hypothetical protein